MPELPEVRTVRKQLNSYIKNKTIKNIIFLNEKLLKEITPEIFIENLKNQTILEVDNRGKFLVFKLTNEQIFLSHLRMNGKYFYYNKTTKPLIHDHVIFEFTDKSFLHYNDSRMFGTFHLRNEKNYLAINPLSKLAQIPANTDAKELLKKINKTTRAIKTILLDQSILVGLGNIYVDETLYASGINPLTPANKITLKQLQSILKNATLIMDKSTELGGSTIDSYASLNKQEGQYQNFLKVHTKVNHSCQKCQSLIKKIRVNGRGTYYCEKCQVLGK